MLFVEKIFWKAPNHLYPVYYNTTRTPGYFLADMMKVNIGGEWKYYSDLSEEELIQQDSDIKRSINNLLMKFNSLK